MQLQGTQLDVAGMFETAWASLHESPAQHVQCAPIYVKNLPKYLDQGGVALELPWATMREDGKRCHP